MTNNGRINNQRQNSNQQQQTVKGRQRSPWGKQKQCSKGSEPCDGRSAIDYNKK